MSWADKEHFVIANKMAASASGAKRPAKNIAADNISLHPKNIYAEGKLDQNATAENFSVVQNEGKRAVAKLIAEYLGCAGDLKEIEELARTLEKKGVRQ